MQALFFQPYLGPTYAGWFQTCKPGPARKRRYEKIELKVESTINCSKNLTVSEEAA